MNVTFNATNMNASREVINLIAVRKKRHISFVNFVHSFVYCPNTLDTVENSESNSHTISCKSVCSETAYTNAAGAMEVHGFHDFAFPKSLSVKHNTTPCIACPVGAECGKQMKALPAYWGVKDDSGFVTMLRCPEGYCCRDESSCRNIDSCGAERRGFLCGQCKGGWTESLFTTDCVAHQSCYHSEIYLLYIVGAFVYAMVLSYSKFIKNVLGKIPKKIWQRLKQSTSRKELDKDEPSKQSEAPDKQEEKQTDSTKDEESGTKYLQNLFYFVQDAALFKVDLPNQESSESALFQALEFSPTVLAMYTDLSRMCLSHMQSPVGKVLFHSLFGYIVLTCLLVCYLLLKCFSRCLRRHPNAAKIIKGGLIQGFLLCVLFSFQKIMKGTFTLIKCVSVSNKLVLHIQGEVECFTWWQHLIHIYILFFIVPFFFVLSHAPFYVQDKTMSVKLFVTTCFLPIPSLVLHCVRNRKRTNNFREKEGFELKNVRDDEREETARPGAGETSEHVLGAETEKNETTEVVCTQEGKTESPDKETDAECAEEILNTLLRHYKTLRFHGFRFTWLGVHKLYRVALVACNTYFTDPVQRLYIMTGLLLLITVVNAFVRPYKDNKANRTAMLSYVANICIAITNITKATMVKFGCQTNCNATASLLDMLSSVEKVLLTWVPVAALVVFILSKAIQKLTEKITARRQKSEEKE